MEETNRHCMSWLSGVVLVLGGAVAPAEEVQDVSTRKTSSRRNPVTLRPSRSDGVVRRLPGGRPARAFSGGTASLTAVFFHGAAQLEYPLDHLLPQRVEIAIHRLQAGEQLRCSLFGKGWNADEQREVDHETGAR